MTGRKAVPGKANVGIYKYTGKRRDTYFVRREVSGKSALDKKLKSDNLNDARREADDCIREWLGIAKKTKVQRLASEHWNEFLLTKSDKSENTIYSIKNSGSHLMEFFGNFLPDEIGAENWEKYISIKRKNTPDRKFFNDWKWFNMFLLYLTDHAHISRRPKIRNPDPKDMKSGKVFDEDQVQKLLINADSSLKLQILMGVTMGMRIGEILNMTWDRIDLKKATISLRAQDTKIRRARAFRISKQVLEILMILPVQSGPLFPSPQKPHRTVGRGGNKSAWRTCRDKSGVEGRFHDLRHTFLTRAFKSSKGRVDLMLICEYAGLSIEQAQETYLHFTHEDTGVVSELVSFEVRENGGTNV